MKGFLVVGSYKPQSFSRQVLVAAKDEDEAIEVSEFDKSIISYVFPWDGRWSFYWYGSLMNIKYYFERYADKGAHIITDDINRDVSEILRKRERKKEKKVDYVKEAMSIVSQYDAIMTKSRSEMIQEAKRMMVEAYNETDKGGFNEWDQTFIELLQNKLLNHLDTEGLNILMNTIEEESNTVKRS